MALFVLWNTGLKKVEMLVFFGDGIPAKSFSAKSLTKKGLLIIFGGDVQFVNRRPRFVPRTQLIPVSPISEMTD